MRTKRRINACNLIQKISSRRGSSSIMIFFSFTVAALMMSMVILQYSHVYLTTEHTQMLADVIADGITVGADSGWGLIYSTSSKGYKDSAVKVKEKLISANTDRTGSGVSYLIEEDYDDKVSLKSSKKTGEKGIRQAYYTIQGKKINNAINVKVTGKTENILSLIEDTYSVRREATSVLNSPTGGIRIAMYAYSFSDSAEAHGRLNPAVSHRTRYVWGAGRGGAEDTSWQQYTDCSGFVSGVYKHFTDESGKRYFFTAYTGALQTVGECVYRGYSSGVDLKKLQPGDIICYWWGSSGYGDSEHVGIYFGDGYQVDCSGGSQNHSPGTMGYGVKFRKIPSAYIEVRRVIRLSGIQSKDNPKALKAPNAPKGSTMPWSSMASARRRLQGLSGVWDMRAAPSPMTTARISSRDSPGRGAESTPGRWTAAPSPEKHLSGMEPGAADTEHRSGRDIWKTVLRSRREEKHSCTTLPKTGGCLSAARRLPSRRS